MARHNARGCDVRKSRSRAGVLGGLLLLSALTLCALPAAAQDSAFVAAMREGRAAYKASDWVTAEKHFDAAAKASENDKQKSTAFYALGVVAQKQNKLPEAKQRAEQALAINPGDKLSKGLLDEVNAATAPAAKGKGKPASKGLVKTPFEPGSKQAAAKTGQPKTAGDAAKAAGKPAAPKATVPKAPAAKPPTSGDGVPPATPGKASALDPSAGEASTAVLPAEATPDASIVAKSAETPATSTQAPPQVMPSSHAEKVAAAEPDRIERPVDQTAAASIVTGAVVQGDGPLPSPVSAMAPAVPVEAPPAPLPQRARYIEVGCGPDYRADGKLFARAFEVTGGTDGQGEVLTFDIACTSRKGAVVPSSELISEDNGGQIRIARLQRAAEGGWMFADQAGVRLARFRPEADALVLLPREGDVAVLRRQLARDPAQLETLPAEVRRDLERAVSGEGYLEFRIVRADDHLDAAFEQARKRAQRIDTSTALSTN